MLNTILVPLDGSRLAETALEPATLLAKRSAAKVLLVRALVPEEPPAGNTHAPHFATTHDAHQYLESVAHYLHSEDVVASTVVLPLEPAEGIVDEAAFRQVDLIVMTTHGRKGMDALLHPSVTWQVLRQTNAPILVCKCANGDDPAAPSLHLPGFMTNPRAPILVPLDGSAQAEAALPIAEELARVFGNRLLLIRTGEQPYLAGGVIGYDTMMSQAMQWSLDEAKSYLKRKAMELASTGLEVEIESAVGGAIPFIEQITQERKVGLIVIASHGRGWLGRLVMGSVAQSILHDGDTPVLLVRRQPIPPEEEQPSTSPNAKEKYASIM